MLITLAVAARIQEEIASLQQGRSPHLTPDLSSYWSKLAREYEALPISADFGGTILLRASGEVISLGWDDEGPVKSLDSESEISALVLGAERYPWLCSLLPERTASARECSVCVGIGKIRTSPAYSGIICSSCYGLGWQP